MTKCDLIPDKDKLEDTLNSELSDLLQFDETKSKFSKLNEKMMQVINESNLVGWLPLDHRDEESITAVLYNIDSSLGYFENQEPRTTDFDM